MQTNKFFILFIFFCLNALFTYSQEQGLKTIVQEDLKRHLTFIASDSLKGRKVGSNDNGLNKAANYIKKVAQENGLKPGVEDYFQNFAISSVVTDSKGSFIELVKNNKPVYKNNDVVNLNAVEMGFLLKDNEIVMAGFGWQDSISGYNDLEGIDISGKVVIYSMGNPELFAENKGTRWNNQLERAKFARVFKQNPVAVIIVTNPKDKENSTFKQITRYFNRQKYTLKNENSKTEIDKILVVEPSFADAVLGKKGRFEKYLGSVAENKKPNSFLVKNLHVNCSFLGDEKLIQTKNIIGIVEGSDPDLKNEYVVFMAHYDHLGINNNGDVYNGADDNGTGVVTLLELAEAFSGLHEKPKRSIVFLWVTGEEIGMFGSQYYTENPVFPLEKTVACFNLDMVGRVYEPCDSVWKKSPKMVKDFDGLFTLSNNVWPQLQQINDSVCSTLGIVPDKSLPEMFLRSSDHYNFHKNNVPVINYSTGYHADYHKVTDEVSKINFDKMKRVADLCFLVGMEVANRKK